jgi:cytochrome P450
MEELSNKDGAQLAGLVTVRGRDDAAQLCALLDEQPQRALIVLKGKTDIDFVADFACPVPVQVICKIPGAPLARLEGQIALKAVIGRIHDARLVDDPPPYRASPTLRGPSALRIVVKGILQRLGA